MEICSFEFPPQNEIFNFYRKSQLLVKSDMFKEYNAKNRIEKFSFFNEIFVEYEVVNTHRIMRRERKVESGW